MDRLLPSIQVIARATGQEQKSLISRLNGKGLPKSKAQWFKYHEIEDEKEWDQQASLLLPGYYDEWQNRNPSGGQVVAITVGHNMFEAETMKLCDVSLGYGKSGQNMLLKSSDIVLLDDSFFAVFQAVMWGRGMNENIQKFIQFQLTVNTVALILLLLASLAGVTLPLNPIMLLWINLIMDTFGAVALGTEPPTLELFDRPPFLQKASLVGKTLQRNILAQSGFQLFVLCFILFNGSSIFQKEDGTPIKHGNVCLNFRDEDDETSVCEKWDYTHYTIVFNVFVFFQIFNEINSRSAHGNNWKATLKGFQNNIYFPLILIMVTGVQFCLVQLFGDFVKTTPLSTGHWIASILIGFFSIPIGMIMRYVKLKDAYAGMYYEQKDPPNSHKD